MAAEDFENLKSDIAKTRGLVALGNEIGRMRVVFHYAYNAELIDKSMRFGSTFKRPSKAVLRKHRNGAAPKMFESAEIRSMLDAAPIQMRTMILLACNCGFGNQDCGTLSISKTVGSTSLDQKPGLSVVALYGQ